MMKNRTNTLLIIILTVSNIFSQEIERLSTHNRILTESNIYDFNNLSSGNLYMRYNYTSYLNTNLPNFENMNGYYFPKGNGFISSFLISYRGRFLKLSLQPHMYNTNSYKLRIPKKQNEFSVLNDVPLNGSKLFKAKTMNTGIQIYFRELSFGYGNWNSWSGPGIHNSLSLSNNANGFYKYFLKLDEIKISQNLYLESEYFVSDPINNQNNVDFFISSFALNLLYKNIDIGFSRQINSGGHELIDWNQNDAFSVLFSSKYIKYWDSYRTYYFSTKFQKSNTIIFYEIAYPEQRFLQNYNPNIYYDHLRATNMGLRKYGAFGSKNLFIGFEYARLIQGLYFNKIPTSNWYDNIKFDYSSYRSRRWAAHSGSDSDDLSIYFGFIKKNKSIIYQFNYERHGITYNFPPEVKFEQKINLSYTIDGFTLYIKYENEYFEHYGFVDNSNNVWDQSYNTGSIQRTKTILFNLEYIIKN